MSVVGVNFRRVRPGFGYGPAPKRSPEDKEHHDDPDAPRVETAGVVVACLLEALGGNVRLAATDARGTTSHLSHVLAALASRFPEPGVNTGKDLGHSEIGDLELAVRCYEQVLRLEITVGDAIPVQVVDSLHQLLE